MWLLPYLLGNTANTSFLSRRDFVRAKDFEINGEATILVISPSLSPLSPSYACYAG